MNKNRAAKAYELISEGFAELALAIRDDTAGAGSVASPQRSAAPVDDDLPPLLDDYGQEVLAAPQPIRPAEQPRLAEQHLENVLSQCPKHQRAWTVKPGGVSKAGKPYEAFWKCGEKDSETRSGFCDKKPVKAWVDAHPASAAA